MTADLDRSFVCNPEGNRGLAAEGYFPVAELTQIGEGLKLLP